MFQSIAVRAGILRPLASPSGARRGSRVPLPFRAFVLVALALLLPFAGAFGKDAATAADLAARLDEYVKAAQDLRQFQGVVLVARDGVPVLEKGYGMANHEFGVPNTPATTFLIGSLTKQFTAAAILQLQEQGKLSVRDPITKHLPSYPREAGDRITIHHLLSHTSGVPSYTEDPALMARRTEDIPLDELVASFQNKPLEFEPGSNWKYSNSGYVLLGRIIEAVSGQTYETYLRAHILDPLGMKDTGYAHPEANPQDRAGGYAFENGSWKDALRISMSLPYAAGALYATAADLLRWDQALYGERVLNAGSKEQMFTPVLQNYGYGQVMLDRFGHREIFHDGGIDGFTSHLARYPDDRMTVIVLCNNESFQAATAGAALAAILFDQPYDLPVLKTPVAIDPARLDDYIGAYAIGDGAYRIIRRDGDRLVSERGGRILPILPEAADRFFYEHDNATTVAFIRDEQGKVVAHVMHQQGIDTRCERVTGAVADSLLAEKTAAEVDPAIYERYAGDYELAPGFVLTVRTREGRLFAQATGQPEFEVFPSSETEFFLKVVDARVSFERDGAGVVTGLVLHQNGRDMPARKVPR